MVLDEDDQAIKDLRMFLHIREDKPAQEKKEIIENLLKDGANVNACDRNYNNNTCLHIAANRTDKDIVQLLIDHGALLYQNKDGKTPVDIAKDKNSVLGNEIAKLLEANGKYATNASDFKQEKFNDKSKQITTNKNKGRKQIKDGSMYAKRAGTSGAGGQFYETKILSFVLYKSLEDAEVEQFYLATNIKDIGDFDDVCFRCKLRNEEKQIIMFLQAKHREDPEKGKLSVAHIKNTTGDFGLGKYFDSFLKIRQKFSAGNLDPMFRGEFKDIDCNFILYTSLKNNFHKKRSPTNTPKKVDSFIKTSDPKNAPQDIFQYQNDQSDIDFLTKYLLEERVKQLGTDFLDIIISTEKNYDGMMTNYLIKVFHPALATHVITVSDVYTSPPNLDNIQKKTKFGKNIDVSQIQIDKYRIGQFRPEFFDSDEGILISLKEILCRGIVINHCKTTELSSQEIKHRIKQTLNKPSSENISRIIGEIVIFDDKNLKLNLNESTIPENHFTNEDATQIKSDLLKIQVSPLIVRDAIIIAGKSKLKLLRFKLPTTFGNSDLSIRGNVQKSTKADSFANEKGEHVKLAASIFLDIILSDKDEYKKMMTNYAIRTFNEDLANHVITVSDMFIIPQDSAEQKQNKLDKFCLGQFRPDFFDRHEDILINLKEILCKEIVIKHSKNTKLTTEEIKYRINEIINKPCAETISTLIGDVVIYDEEKHILLLNEGKFSKNLFEHNEIIQIKSNLLKVSVTQAIINDAILIAGVPKLKSLVFKLPFNFGKLDLSVQESDTDLPEKVLKRINFLATKILNLIEKFKETKIVQIDNGTVGPGKILDGDILDTNGGIGGTVGNLLILDTESNNMLVFNTVENTLPIKAKYLLKRLKSGTKENLSSYKISVNVENFPKTHFHANQYEQKLAQDFFNMLWFYTGQAKEDEVENKLKGEMDKNYNTDKNQDQLLFRAHSDAIFLHFHDKIQKWWKLPTQASYLTEKDKIFDQVKKDIIDKPLSTVLNVMCIRKLKKIALKFKSESIDTLDLDNFTEGLLNVVSDAVLLSAAKINQLIRSKKYNSNIIFIHLQYLFTLPNNDYNTLMYEFKKTEQTTTLIMISETPIDSMEQRNKLNNIFIEFNGKKIIVITGRKLNNESTKHFAKKNYALNDASVNLTDLTPESQSKVLKESKLIYQGEEVPLNVIIDETSIQQKRLVRAKLLSVLTSNRKVKIGHELITPKYEKIKDRYIYRPLIYNGEEQSITNLNDISDNTVIISGKPCYGKTSLLINLALETKKDNPRTWIVSINLSNHTKDFQAWKDKDLDINMTLNFLCQIALSKCDETKHINFYEIDDTIYCNCVDDTEVPFEVELFINFYNNNNIIFLFDSFDKTYPEHTRECMKIFRLLVNQKNRLWITTSTYFSNMLESEFGMAYKLDRLCTQQQQGFLHRFWKTNLKLEKLNHEQFNNISSFFEFMSKTFNLRTAVEEENRKNVTVVSLPLHIIYLTAVEYFKNELIHLSPKFIRDEIKRKWRLDSFTGMDKYLRKLDKEEERSSELAGTPLHMYIAANYFQFQIKDRLILKFDTDEIENKFSVYINAATSYERFLKMNMKKISEIDSKDLNEKEQEKLRDDFFEKHKKLALYAICKESDIAKLLTEEDINEVKTTIHRIETGEEPSDMIDCIIDGIPRFHNLLFAEYFAVEFASHLLKAASMRDPKSLRFESVWDAIVNGLLLLSPPGVRNAFEYKLKYDPELKEVAGTEQSKKIIFDLILKQEKAGNTSQENPNTILNTAINEGLVNLSSVLLLSAKNNITPDNMDVGIRIIKSGALILSVVDPAWKEVADNIIENSRDFKATADAVDASQIEVVSRALVSLFSNTETGQNLNTAITTRVCEPIRKLTEKMVESSNNNENLTKVVEQIACRLPDVINSLFGK